MAGNRKTIVKYFGWATNADLDMMFHMVGRRDIHKTPAILLGFEPCIQVSNKMREEIPPSSPYKVSPRKIIMDVWGPDFNMYVTRPNPEAHIAGVIWDLTPEELELVKEWECIEYGVQDEIKAKAVQLDGTVVEVDIQTLTRPTDQIDKVIKGDIYETYIAPKDKMLEVADKIRIDYLNRKHPTK